MYNFILAHPFGTLLGVFYVFSAAIGAMPEPGTVLPPLQAFYQWFFVFLHTLLNQVEAAAKAKYPQLNIPGGTNAVTTEVAKTTTTVVGAAVVDASVPKAASVGDNPRPTEHL